MRRLGFGVHGASLKSDSKSDEEIGKGLGVVLRLRGDSAELELEATQYERTYGTSRLDTRLGGAVIFYLTDWSVFRPYALAGLGVNMVRPDETWEPKNAAKQSYLVGGFGAGLALSRRIVLAVDLRWAAFRAIHDEHSEEKVYQVIALPEKEQTFETRFMGLLYF